MQFTMYVVVLAMVLIGGESIISGDMHTGELTSVIVYAHPDPDVSYDGVLCIRHDHDRGSVYGTYQRGFGRSTGDGRQSRMQSTEVTNGDIEFEHVNFSYAGEGGNLSLKDVNLHIKSGQIVGIIGGTGSAKSTLVQLIPRLYDVTLRNSESRRNRCARIIIWKPCGTRCLWFFRKMCCFTGSIYENIRWGDETASDEEVRTRL